MLKLLKITAHSERANTLFSVIFFLVRNLCAPLFSNVAAFCSHFSYILVVAFLVSSMLFLLILSCFSWISVFFSAFSVPFQSHILKGFLTEPYQLFTSILNSSPFKFSHLEIPRFVFLSLFLFL